MKKFWVTINIDDKPQLKIEVKFPTMGEDVTPTQQAVAMMQQESEIIDKYIKLDWEER